MDARRLAPSAIFVPSGGAQSVRLVMSSQLGLRKLQEAEVSLENLKPRLGKK